MQIFFFCPFYGRILNLLQEHFAVLISCSSFMVEMREKVVEEIRRWEKRSVSCSQLLQQPSQLSVISSGVFWGVARGVIQSHFSCRGCSWLLFLKNVSLLYYRNNGSLTLLGRDLGFAAVFFPFFLNIHFQFCFNFCSSRFMVFVVIPLQLNSVPVILNVDTL